MPPPPPPPDKINTYAYSIGKRRESAVLIQDMVRWRLAHGRAFCKLGSTMTGFDASNAFMRVDHEVLDKLMD